MRSIPWLFFQFMPIVSSPHALLGRAWLCLHYNFLLKGCYEVPLFKEAQMLLVIFTAGTHCWFMSSSLSPRAFPQTFSLALCVTGCLTAGGIFLPSDKTLHLSFLNLLLVNSSSLLDVSPSLQYIDWFFSLLLAAKLTRTYFYHLLKV